MFSIVTVVAAFWLGTIFEGWPFARLRNRVVATVAMLLGVYVVALAGYYALFNFSFLPPLDSATLAFTFPLLATHADFFDYWPLGTDDELVAGTEAEELPGV